MKRKGRVKEEEDEEKEEEEGGILLDEGHITVLPPWLSDHLNMVGWDKHDEGNHIKRFLKTYRNYSVITATKTIQSLIFSTIYRNYPKPKYSHLMCLRYM